MHCKSTFRLVSTLVIRHRMHDMPVAVRIWYDVYAEYGQQFINTWKILEQQQFPFYTAREHGKDTCVLQPSTIIITHKARQQLLQTCVWWLNSVDTLTFKMFSYVHPRRVTFAGCVLWDLLASLGIFSVAFAKLRKASSCLYLRMEQLGSHWTDFDEMSYLRVFRKFVPKIQASLKSYKNNG